MSRNGTSDSINEDEEARLFASSRGSARRQNIFVPAPTQAEYNEAKLHTSEKCEEDVVLIQEALSHNCLFSALDEAQQREISRFMTLEKHSKGENIVIEGESGNTFYIIKSGTISFHKKINGENQRVGEAHKGGSFGELAIMYTTKRAATCRSETDVELWSIPGTLCRSALNRSIVKRREVYRKFLSSVPELASLTDEEQSMLADALSSKTFKSGEVIVKQGEKGNKMYFIIEGKVSVLRKCEDDEGLGTKIAELSDYEWFGEGAIISPEGRRNASVVADTTVRTAVLDAATFNRLLNPLADKLQRS